MCSSVKPSTAYDLAFGFLKTVVSEANSFCAGLPFAMAAKVFHRCRLCSKCSLCSCVQSIFLFKNQLLKILSARNSEFTTRNSEADGEKFGG